MPHAPLPPLNPDERILLTRETKFKKRQLWWLLLIVPVFWSFGFVTLRIVAAFRGFGMPPLADALFSGAFVLIGFIVSLPLGWLMERGRVWVITNQRIIDNKGLELPIARIDRVTRRGVIRCRDIPAFFLPDVTGAELRAILGPLLGTTAEQFPSVLPQSGPPQGVPHPSASTGAAFWSPRLQPDEILLWSGQERAFLPALLALIFAPMTAFALFAAAQGLGLVECGRTCPSALLYVPGNALLLAIMAGLVIWLRHPARYAVTDRRALSSATRIQRGTRVGTGATELPLSGADFMVLPTEVWISESERGHATRFVAMPGLSKAQTKALERVLFALIRRCAMQAFSPPPQP